MIALLLFILFGLFFGYFSTLNTGLVAIHIGSYTLSQIPVYILVITSIAVGVLFTSLFYFVKYVGVQLTQRKLEKELSESKQHAADLLKKIHQLELQSVKLQTENGQKSDDEESI